MAAENHSPPARSLRRTQCTILWVVYNCALITQPLELLAGVNTPLSMLITGMLVAAGDVPAS